MSTIWNSFQTPVGILFCAFILLIIFLIVYNNTFPFSTTPYAIEGLQNYDVSNLSYGTGSGSNVEPFYKHLYQNINNADAEDASLSSIINNAPYYNSTLFNMSNNSGDIYDISSVERDIKYFNNVTHMLSRYKLKNMISDEQ